MWRVGPGGRSEVVTSRMDLRLGDHDGIVGRPIDEFLSLEGREDLEVRALASSVTLPGGRELQLSPPKKEEVNGRIVLRSAEGLTRTKEGEYAADPLRRGIFVGGRAEGFLRHRLLMRLKNNSFYLNVRNHYSFAGSFGDRPEGGLRLVVTKKEDDHFRHLHRFNRIDI